MGENLTYICFWKQMLQQDIMHTKYSGLLFMEVYERKLTPCKTCYLRKWFCYPKLYYVALDVYYVLLSLGSLRLSPRLILTEHSVSSPKPGLGKLLQRAKYFRLWGPRVIFPTIQMWHISVKEAIDNMYTNEPGHISVRLWTPKFDVLWNIILTIFLLSFKNVKHS